MFFFIESSLIIILVGSASFSFSVSSVILGIDCSISFPLLKVMIAFTSSILELLEEPISWTPSDFAVSGKGIFLSPVPPTN